MAPHLFLLSPEISILFMCVACTVTECLMCARNMVCWSYIVLETCLLRLHCKHLQNLPIYRLHGCSLLSRELLPDISMYCLPFSCQCYPQCHICHSLIRLIILNCKNGVKWLFYTSLFLLTVEDYTHISVLQRPHAILFWGISRIHC